MRLGRRSAGLAAASAFVAGLVLAAPTADAAEILVTADCVTTWTVANRVTLTVHAGDSVVVSGPSCNYRISHSDFAGLFDSIPPSEIASVFTWVLKPSAAPGTYGTEGTGYVFSVFADGSSCGIGFCGESYDLIVLADASPDAPPVPDWVQAYGRASADAACPDGWDPSWGQWPNGGRGGYVCARSIPSIG